MRRRIFYLTSLALVVFSLVASVLPTPKASANLAGETFTYGSGNKTIIWSFPDTQNSATGYDIVTLKNSSAFPKVYTNGSQLCGGDVTVDSPGALTATVSNDCNQSQSRRITLNPAGTHVPGTPNTYQGSWVDHSEISVGIDGQNYTFLDGKIDDNLTFTMENAPNSCVGQDQIYGFSHGGANTANATATVSIDVYTQSTATGNSSCVPEKGDILQLSNSNSDFGSFFVWQDSATISTSDQSGILFCNKDGGNTKCGTDKNTFLAVSGRDEGSTTCQSEIDPNPGDPLHGTLIERWSGSSPAWGQGWPGSLNNPGLHPDGGCNVSNPIKNVLIADPIDANGKLASDAAAGSSKAGQALGQDSSSNQTLGCDYQFSSPLTWILCPIIQLFGRFAAAGDYIITQELNVNTKDIFCNDANSPCQAYYAAWQSFRNIALGLMVIGGLIMLIAQALGAEIMDAYTIRKVLPRILISAVVITLSWPLMQLAVTLSNDLGVGIRALIYQPFANLGGNAIHIQLTSSHALDFLFGGVGALAGTVAFATWLAFGGLGILISLVGTAALAVLIALMVLVLRQIAITLLIITAPVALVAFILPNTQKLYHIWWESFSKALLMFPLIAGLIASGRVFSAVANSQATSQGSSLNGLFFGFAAFASYFAPYFLIPATFKLAGGALRQIGGFVNDRSRGGFDRLRTRRGERRKKMAENFGHKFQHEGFAENKIPARFKRTRAGVNRLARTGNRVGGMYAAGLSGGYGLGHVGATAKQNAAWLSAVEELKDPKLQGLRDDNASMRYLTYLNRFHGDEAKAQDALTKWYTGSNHEYPNTEFSKEQAEEKTKTAVSNVRASGGWTETKGRAAAMLMAQDGTALRGTDDMLAIAGFVSGGSATNAYRFMSQMSSDSGSKSRSDLVLPQEVRTEAAAAMAATNGGTELVDKSGKVLVPEIDDIREKAMLSGHGSTNGYAKMAQSPSRVIRSGVEEPMEVIRKAIANPTDEVLQKRAIKAAVDIKSMEASLYSAKPDNADTFIEAMGQGDRQAVLAQFMSQPSLEKKRVPKTDPANPDAAPVIKEEPVRIAELVVGRLRSDISRDPTIPEDVKAGMLREAEKQHRTEEEQG